MQGDHLTYTVVVPGTLAANITVTFSLPFLVQLEHVSAVGSNANDGKLILGISGDDDAYLTSSAIGDSSTPAEFTKANFVGTQPVHIAAGTIFVASLDYDGASGTATANFTMVLTFSEG
jgi:hypothetical protein